MNTDGKFWAYKQVAILPDRTGMYRASIIRFSELYNWSESALANTIARESTSLPAKLIGPMSREEYDSLERIGYCTTPDADAPMIVREWRPL